MADEPMIDLITGKPLEPWAELAMNRRSAAPDEIERTRQETIALIDEINERSSSRKFYGIGQTLHAKLCTIRATLALAALSRPNVDDLTRPIVGIENRTAQEAFDIMADRIRAALNGSGNHG